MNNKKAFNIITLLIMITQTMASIQLIDVVRAPSYMMVKLIQDGTNTFDIQLALASNVTQMSFNLSTISFTSSNVPSTAFWLPINATMAISVMTLGSFLSPNGTVLILTYTDVHPFRSFAVIVVDMSTEYSITALERAYDTPDCTSVYALLSTNFMRSPTLVAEISIINGSLLRQFNASVLPVARGLANIWDIPSSDHIIVMINSVGVFTLKRNSLELIKLYQPNDGIFQFEVVGGAVLMNTDTIIWSNVTRQSNLTELRIWNFVTQENSSSILLTNKTIDDLELVSSYIGIDHKTGNIWTTFVSMGPGTTYLGTSIIYHYINQSSTIHSEIRWGEWAGWVLGDHSQLGAIIIDDSLIVATLIPNDTAVIQKFVDNEDDPQY